MTKRGKNTTETADALGALEIAGNEFAELAEEMRNWADSMASANMEHLDKYQEVEAAADALENADVASLVETLREYIDAAIEGQTGHAACPPHGWGVPCPNCGWDGNATTLHVVPPEEHKVWKSNDLHAPRPMRITVGTLYYTAPATTFSPRKRVELVKFNAAWKEGLEPPPGAIEETLARIAPRQAQEEAKFRGKEPPVGRSFDPSIEPLPGFSDLATAKVTWIEFHPYGKRGTSRADRFANALGAAQAGLEAVEHVLDGIKLEAGDEDTPELELLESLRDAFEEVKQAVDELQGGVEFPGMY